MVSKESACNAGDLHAGQKTRFSPWVGKIPWKRKWQPTPVFLPRKSHGQRSLLGYSPWGHEELDTTEVTWYTEISARKLEIPREHFVQRWAQ